MLCVLHNSFVILLLVNFHSAWPEVKSDSSEDCGEFLPQFAFFDGVYDFVEVKGDIFRAEARGIGSEDFVLEDTDEQFALFSAFDETFAL